MWVPVYEQTHAAFEVGLSLDQGQGVYSGWSDVDGSSQLRLCHTCIIDVMVYVTASSSRYFSMYIVFFITSKLWWKLKYIDA